MSRWTLCVGASLRPATAGLAKTLRVAVAGCSLLAAASADRALAADWPDALRGSLTPSYARWDGWQIGVQAGIASMRSDWRVVDLRACVPLTIVRFTLIAVMTGPIKQKRAASGYELLKGDDELVTTGRLRT
jgi:hypothetical protein